MVSGSPPESKYKRPAANSRAIVIIRVEIIRCCAALSVLGFVGSIIASKESSPTFICTALLKLEGALKTFVSLFLPSENLTTSF